MGHGPKPGMLKGAIDGANIWWVAPTYEQVKNSEIWTHLKRSCMGAATRISEVDKTVVLPGGGKISIHSADSGSSLRGAGVDGMIIDEAAFLSEETWTEELRPSIADRLGWVMMQTTPNGKNWFYKLFKDAEHRPGWQCWQRPSTDNPLMTHNELEEIKRDIGPRRFAQEHGAQFTDIEGAMFPAEYFEDHIYATRWPDAFEVCVMAIDPSIGAESKIGDYSAIATIGLSGGKYWVEMDLDRRPPIQLVEDATRIAHRVNPVIVAVESNAFQAVLADLFGITARMNNLAELPIVLVNNHEKKGVRIQRLDSHLANKSLRFRPSAGTDLTIEQLQMFPSKDWNDDGPDALEMAIRTMSHVRLRAFDQEVGIELVRT